MSNTAYIWKFFSVSSPAQTRCRKPAKSPLSQGGDRELLVCTYARTGQPGPCCSSGRKDLTAHQECDCTEGKAVWDWPLLGRSLPPLWTTSALPPPHLSPPCRFIQQASLATDHMVEPVRWHSTSTEPFSMPRAKGTRKAGCKLRTEALRVEQTRAAGPVKAEQLLQLHAGMQPSLPHGKSNNLCWLGSKQPWRPDSPGDQSLDLLSQAQAVTSGEATVWEHQRLLQTCN